MSFALTRWADEKTWNDFVATSPSGSIFCHTEILKALGTPFELWGVTDGAEPLLAVPLLFERGTQCPIVAPHAFTTYQGPLFSAAIHALPAHSRYPLQLQLLEFLIEALTAKYPRVSLCLHPAVHDIRAFTWWRYHAPPQEHFVMTPRYTGLLDLTAFATHAEYVASIRKVRRYEARHAVREDCTIVQGTMAHQDIVRALYTDTFARQEIVVALQHLQWLDRLLHFALVDGHGELLLCTNPTGDFLAATLFLYDRTTAYYLLAANNTDFRKSGASTLLLLELIDRARARGMRSVDFIGVNSPTRGDFKIGFNAVPTVYYVVNWNEDVASRRSPVAG